MDEKKKQVITSFAVDSRTGCFMIDIAKFFKQKYGVSISATEIIKKGIEMYFDKISADVSPDLKKE
jgi:hypothetical protein